MRREYKEFDDEIYEIEQRIKSEIVEMFKENGVERINLDYGFTMVWADYRLREVWVTGLSCKVEDYYVDIRFYDKDGESYKLGDFINGIPVLSAYKAAYDYFYNKDDDEDEDDEDWDDEEEDEDDEDWDDEEEDEDEDEDDEDWDDEEEESDF